MTFINSIKTCFRKYIDFSGRASRSEFWWFYLFFYLILYDNPANILATRITSHTNHEPTSPREHNIR